MIATSSSPRALAITGYGVVSAAGFGVEALRELVVSDRAALARRSRVPSSLVDPGFTGTVPDELDTAFTMLPGAEVQRFFVAWAIAAGREALARAGVHARHAPDRIALVIGSNLEDYPEPLWALLDPIAEALGLAGPRLVVSMACASSLAALELGRDLLERGDADAVVVGGSDVLTPRVAGGFRRLELLADAPCAPFSATYGTALGEGAGLLVLEREAVPGSDPMYLLGEGSAADAHHETSPEPRGRGSEAALRRALRCSGCDASLVDLVMAHGTGTLANDAAEAHALRRVFGPELARVRVGAGKSLVGHAQGAAGAIELIAALVGIEAGVLPAIAHFAAPARPEVPPRLLIDEAARREPVECAMIEGAGFGGAHAAAIVGRGRAREACEAAERVAARRLSLRGVAQLGANEEGRIVIDGRRAVRGVDLRRADPSTAMLTTVVDMALAHAGVARTARRAYGLHVAQRGSSAAAIGRLRSELEQFGVYGAAASAFVDSLAIMPAGACTRALELHGPLQLVCGDALAGLVALISACELLLRDPTLPGIVVAGVIERAEAQPSTREGASALVVGEGGDVALLGWSIVGPGRDALALALARSGVDRIDRIVRLDTIDQLALARPTADERFAWLAEGRGGAAALVLGTGT